MKIGHKWTSQGAKKALLKRWGQRFTCAVFPVEGGQTRVTMVYEGAEHVFAGKDRSKVLEEAFKRMKALSKPN